jgi:DNA-directed RNA polymerase specialized sigma24 family protein
MTFGTDKFFRYLKDHIADNDYDSFYYEVASVVDADARAMLYSKGIRVSANISKEDIDDLVQEIQCSVFKGLYKFIRDFDHKEKGQRSAWLATIADRRIKDFFRRYYKRIETGALSLDNEDDYVKLQDRTIPDNDEVIIAAENNEASTAIYNTLKYLFSIRTKNPERILVYLFNKFAVAFSDTARSSGSPKAVAELLNGNTLGYAAGIMKQIIRNTVRHDLPADVFDGLDEKLEMESNGIKNSERILYFETNRISDITNKISAKIELNKDLIPGEYADDFAKKEKKT